MSWIPLYIPDFILAPSFGCFLAVLTMTKDQSLRTPFFKFFVVTGICGLSTVITHILMNRVIWPANFWWMPDSLLLINQSGMLGATFGKFFIALHRYFVLREVAANEKVWSTRLVHLLIIIQVALPFLITGICFSFGFVVQTISNGTIAYNVAAQGQIIQKFIWNVLTGIYVIVSVVLTYLSSRKLNELQQRLEGLSKRAVLRHQKNMFIVVAVCSLSHILKAGQQSLIVIYSLNGKIDRSVYETLLWPTFVVTNGLATYAPPLILIYCSSRIRSLLFGRITGVRDFGSSENTVNATGKTPQYSDDNSARALSFRMLLACQRDECRYVNTIVQAKRSEVLCPPKSRAGGMTKLADQVCLMCHSMIDDKQANFHADCIANDHKNEKFKRCLDVFTEKSKPEKIPEDKRKPHEKLGFTLEEYNACMEELDDILRDLDREKNLRDLL